MQHTFLLLSVFTLLPTLAFPWDQNMREFNGAKNFEGSPGSGGPQYHMGPVLASPALHLYIIWYGHWNPNHQSTIREFIHSISQPSRFPSVSDWWKTVRLYTDQTGSNITGNIVLSGEFYDSAYSHGRYLSRLSMQSVIKNAVSRGVKGLPLNANNGLYLVLTGGDVQVQDFCRAVCGFHFYTYPHVAGAILPYAWIGYSGTQCPGLCAYPFSWDKYSLRPPPTGGFGILKAPNGDAAVDGMISVIAHELAEVASNPLINAWYAGDNPVSPNEIADMCLGVYGTGAGGGYIGQVSKDNWGNGFNVNGVKGRKFLIQWIWNPVKGNCFGPNA